MIISSLQNRSYPLSYEHLNGWLKYHIQADCFFVWCTYNYKLDNGPLLHINLPLKHHGYFESMSSISGATQLIEPARGERPYNDLLL